MITAKKIFFSGIGGSGCSSMALWLKSRGFEVSGSDIAQSRVTENLRDNGIAVQIGHKVSDLLKESDLVVYSSAIKGDSEELVFARNSGKQVVKRAKILAMMAQESENLVAVCGSAGKSSTTGFMACVLNAAKKDPSVIVGGVFCGRDSGMQAGGGEYFLSECDEYDRSFLEMKNIKLALCTSIEAEHLEIYGNFKGVQDGFMQFFDGIRQDGVLVASWASEGVREIYPQINRRKVSFGLTADSDYIAKNIRYESGKTCFEVSRRGEYLGNVELKIIGEHNVLNALGAIAAGVELGIDFDTAAKGVGEFEGIKRRIEKIATIDGITIISDYAHHPTKISATLSALQKTKSGRIITVFQPHTFTRTRDFAENFAGALESGSDIILLTEIYPARENPIEGVSEKSIAKFFKNNTSRIIAKNDIAEECGRIAKSGDTIVVMGAGDIDEKIDDLISELKNGKK